MARTDPDILDQLRRGGVLPVYWRRKRATARWHRGMRIGSLLVRSQCDKLVAADGNRVVFSPIEGPWPDPHCLACEWAMPGTLAAREGLDPNEGVSSRPGWPGRSHPVRKSHRRPVRG